MKVQEIHFVRVQTYRWSDNARQCQCRFEKNLDFLLKCKTKGVSVSKAYFGGPNPDKITKFKFSRRIQLWNSFPASINIKSNSLLNIEIFISHYKLEIEIYAAQCKTRTTFSRKSARLRDAIDWIKSGKKHKVEFLQKNLNSDSGPNLSCWVHIFSETTVNFSYTVCHNCAE